MAEVVTLVTGHIQPDRVAEVCRPLPESSHERTAARSRGNVPPHRGCRSGGYPERMASPRGSRRDARIRRGTLCASPDPRRRGHSSSGDLRDRRPGDERNRLIDGVLSTDTRSSAREAAVVLRLGSELQAMVAQAFRGYSTGARSVRIIAPLP